MFFPAFGQAVAVKLQLGAFIGQNESVVLGGIKLRHLADKGFFMRFDLAAKLPLVFRSAASRPP
jgi:hypothetical protein